MRCAREERRDVAYRRSYTCDTLRHQRRLSHTSATPLTIPSKAKTYLLIMQRVSKRPQLRINKHRPMMIRPLPRNLVRTPRDVCFASASSPHPTQTQGTYLLIPNHKIVPIVRMRIGHAHIGAYGTFDDGAGAFTVECAAGSVDAEVGVAEVLGRLKG